jgi:hypothetical protein
LANIVVVMLYPLSSVRSASLATSVLPRRMPCWKREPDDFEFLLLDDFAQAAGRFLLPARPETVTLDEAQRVAPSRH